MKTLEHQTNKQFNGSIIHWFYAFLPGHAVIPERATDFRTSTTSLSTHWPERSFSDKWEREDATSLCEDIPLPLGGSASQPAIPWPELRKGKRKKSGILSGRLRRSTGSKRGSITSVGEWAGGDQITAVFLMLF